MELKTDEVDKQTRQSNRQLEAMLLDEAYQRYSHADDFCCPVDVLPAATAQIEESFSRFNRNHSMVMQAGQCLGKEDLLLMNSDRKRKFTARAITRCCFLFLHHDHYMQHLGSLC